MNVGSTHPLESLKHFFRRVWLVLSWASRLRLELSTTLLPPGEVVSWERCRQLFLHFLCITGVLQSLQFQARRVVSQLDCALNNYYTIITGKVERGKLSWWAKQRTTRINKISNNCMYTQCCTIHSFTNNASKQRIQFKTNY